jgi:hypothetical protein
VMSSCSGEQDGVHYCICYVCWKNNNNKMRDAGYAKCIPVKVDGLCYLVRFITQFYYRMVWLWR